MTDLAPEMAPDGNPVPPEVTGDEPDTKPDGPLTIETAYEKLQEAKDETHEDSNLPPAGGSEPAQESADVDDGGNGPGAPEIKGLSADDRETVRAIEQEAQSFQRDLQDFALAKEKFAELERTNPDRAKALKPQLREAERELKERYGALQQAAGTVYASASQKYLTGEQAKMAEAMPALATDEGRAELRRYLTKEVGFSEQDLSGTVDHRLAVLAEKARRYDEMTGQKGKTVKRIPRIRKPGKAEPAVSEEFTSALDEINTRGISRENATRLFENRPARADRAEPTVQELQRKLRKTGSMDDAYAVLRARRQQGS